MVANVSQVLHQGALRHPERVALVTLSAAGDMRVEHSYGALDMRARCTAAALQQAGIAPGARVMITAENGADFVIAWFGALYAGCVLLPAPILSAPPELGYRLRHAQCQAVLCDRPRMETVKAAIAALERPVRVFDVAVAAAALPLPAPVSGAAGDPTAMVLYTSGTTGEAKGASIAHDALFTHTAVLAYHALRLSPEDVVLGVLPLTHSYGCRMVMLASLYAGCRAVLLPRFDAAVSMAAMLREGVTWLPAVPTMFAAFANLPQGPAPALRWAMCAGAPLADAIARRAEARLGTEIRQGFGMTEATIATLNAPPDRRVLRSVGKPVWGIELRVVDPEGRDVAPGERGEVWIRGHNMMSHYLHDPGATESALTHGFLRSGDIGTLDTDGRLYIVDRIKDLIIRGGNNVYPSEVESALSHHPAVAESAVVGRPDPYYGEEVVAVVVRRPGHTAGADELIAWLRERIARTKLPREVLFVDQLPLGPSGKVLKRTLKAQLAAGSLQP